MNAERLLKLARALDRLHVGGDPAFTFDFAEWWEERDCGTAGCAIGYCPIVFPENWRLVRGRPTIDGKNGPLDSAEIFFDLTKGEALMLFTPGEQGPDLPHLGPDATAGDVARNIRLFCELKEDRNP